MCRRVNRVDATDVRPGSHRWAVTAQRAVDTMLTPSTRVDLWHAPREHPRRMAPASSTRQEHAETVGTQRRWREQDSTPLNRIVAGQQCRALRARRGSRRFVASGGCVVARLWLWPSRLPAMGWSVPVGHRSLCSACGPVGQHGGGGLPREPWIVAFEHERQTSEISCPPRDGGHLNGVEDRTRWSCCTRGARDWTCRNGTRRCACGSLVPVEPGPPRRSRPGGR